MNNSNAIINYLEEELKLEIKSLEQLQESSETFLKHWRGREVDEGEYASFKRILLLYKGGIDKSKERIDYLGDLINKWNS